MSSPRSYLTLAAGRLAEASTEVRRSRFLAVVGRVEDEEAARSVVAQQRRIHHDAGHHCIAFVLGPDRHVRRSSDDGEPAGTAGSPMLETLTGAGLSDVVAVVSRWFGGTMLGAGGLARAYGDAVAQALEDAPIVRRVERVVSEVELPHALAGRVEAQLRARGIEVLGTDYARLATLRLATDTAATAAQAVAAATSGEGVPRDCGTVWGDE